MIKKCILRLILIFSLVTILNCMPLSMSKIQAGTIETVAVPVKYQQSSARSMLSMINDFRTGSEAWIYNSNGGKDMCSGLKPLIYDYELEEIAMIRAAEITMYYSHTRPNLTMFNTLIDDRELKYSLIGENIAAGYNKFSTAESVFEAWKETNCSYAGQSHRRNMLNQEFTAVGIAHIYYNGSHFWVQEFRNPVGSVTETLAVNTFQNVDVSLDMTSVKVTLIPSVSYVNMKVGTQIKVPTVDVGIKTAGSWPDAFDYFLVKSNIVWNTTDASSLKIENNKLIASKEGNVYLQGSTLGKTIEIPVTISAQNDHVWDNGVVVTNATCSFTGIKRYTCTDCGETREESIEKINHVWDTGTITKNSTCTADGEKMFRCTLCNETKTESIAKIGHAFSTAWTVDKAATCTAAGSMSHHCTRNGCNAKGSITSMPALGHYWNDGVVTKNPSCTDSGLKKIICLTCNESKNVLISALGHTYSTEWTVDKIATCTTTGSKSHHCIRSGCSAKENVTAIAVIDHKVVTDSAVAATFTQEGKTEGVHCEWCNEVLAEQETVNKAVCGTISKKYVYTGSQISPEVAVTDSNDKPLEKGTDYTLEYGANKKLGSGTVTVKLTGRYEGEQTLSFAIIPENVKGVTVKSNSYNSIKISWNKGNPGCGYCIYRSTSKDGTYKLIKTIGTYTTISYVDSGLTCGKNYYYKVRAYKTIDGVKTYSKAYSSVSTIKPSLTKPTINSIKKNSGNTVSISWSKVSGASGYEVYRATSKNGKYSKITMKTNKSGSSYYGKNTKLVKGKTYYFKVRAYRNVNGKKVYGSFSSIKAYTLKK